MTSLVTFIGFHNSGKTTVVSQVVRHLKEFGYRVAVIKSSSESGVVFDTSGTDTAKHKEAGADAVLFVAPDQMVLQAHASDQSLSTLAHRYFPDIDIVIGEGFKHARRVPKIEVTRDPEQQLRNEVHGVIAVVTDQDLSGDYVFRMNESRELAMFLEKRFLLDNKRGPNSTSLLVNGRKVPLKGFVQDSLSLTVQGFLQSLKFTEEPREIELRIKVQPVRKEY